MQFGLNLPTHGVMSRDGDGNCRLTNIDPSEMRPVERSIRAEELGFHSVWLSDHIVTEAFTEGVHPANSSGKRAYPERPVMLDVATTFGAIASRTSTIRFCPTVYIAPYRHPLITAHEWATLDVLSGGRAMMAVGVGWEIGEFEALGADFERRGSVLYECLQIYRQAWENSDIAFDGKHFQIHGVSMDLKPVQSRIPIWYGGMSEIAAKRAARLCQGFYPMFLDSRTHPADLDFLRTAIVREAVAIGRDLSDFTMAAYCQVGLRSGSGTGPSSARPFLTGTAEQILDDLNVMGSYGYEHVTVQFDCPSGTASEHVEQTEMFAAQVLPHAGQIASVAIAG
ncbi:TIGR03619 family F420-dependent LLM class oxidoreductase [[Mycobacterium] wendilense]|uniref:TIGR03619 family F420-dependent LLM class oxidoreductase n=1 Tax=[Mycobacterium] wendilense TaxID=3064284 RepID=A0ABN9P1C3_9MYCO|nr:TIGR03619 family F420-dependent LLM class oxidoreductase [Mycolicibacterium sp. MU0050]CAJ1579876.1 TIGR03619 family F420-dependent LLM class oxidoreductase [Mycolicibacterium sp. MU0050]